MMNDAIDPAILELCGGDEAAARTVAAVRTTYGDDHWWDGTDWEKAWGQFNEDALIIPFGEFHRALEAALGRPVWTHELALGRDRLREELLAKRLAPDQAASPTMQEIIDLIPPEKRIVVELTEDDT